AALWKWVWGHDGLCSLVPSTGGGACDQPIHDRGKSSRVERLADHSGGREKHVRGFASRGSGGNFCREPGRLASGLAGESVGVARIDEKGTCRAGLKMRAAPIDWSGGAFRACKNASDSRA